MTDHEARAREIVEKHVSYTDLGPDEGLLMTVDGGNDNALISAIAKALSEVEEARDARIASLEEAVAKAFLALGEVAEALEPLTCRSTPEHEADDAEREIAVTTGEIRKAKAVRERINVLCHASPVPGCETSSPSALQSDDGETR